MADVSSSGNQPQEKPAVQPLSYDEIKQRKEFLENLRLESIRWKTRRRFAIASFICLVVILIFYMFVGLFVDMDCVKRIGEFNSIVITLVGFLTAPVLVYIGALSWSDKNGTTINMK